MIRIAFRDYLRGRVRPNPRARRPCVEMDALTWRNWTRREAPAARQWWRVGRFQRQIEDVPEYRLSAPFKPGWSRWEG